MPEGSDSKTEEMKGSYSKLSRHSTHKGDQEMVMRLRRVLTQQEFKRGSQIAEISPEDAMASLLGHVRFDQDGGLLNLTSDPDAERNSQYTKLHILFKKSDLRSGVGCILVMRLLINVPHVFKVSIHDLYCYFSEQCVVMELVDHCALPLVSMCVAVAAYEVVHLSLLVFGFLKNVLTFACTKEQGSATDGLAKRRYSVLSNIFLEDMTQLQGFSALRLLENVHPGCITHFAKELTMCDAAARAIFERLLGRTHDDLSDDDLHDMILQIMVRAEMAGSEMPEELVLRCSMFSSYGLFKELRRLPELPQNDPDGGSLLVDPQAISNHGWKVFFVAFSESFIFLASCFVLAIFGSSAFVVKLVHVNEIMMDSDAKLYHVVLAIMSFLNQCVSIVAVQPLLRQRIFCFLFGGQDANVSNEEKSLMIAYQAILAEKIWRARPDEASYTRKCLTLLTLSDDDIQRLTLEEATESKTLVTRAVFKQAKEEHLESTNLMELCCEPILQSIHGPDNGSSGSYTQMRTVEAEASDGEVGMVQ